jgi:hypothetical protein
MARIDKPTVVADTVSLLSLARELHQSGRYKAAEALFQQAASQVEKSLGPDDAFLANILDAYAEFLASLQRGVEAASMRERSNQIRGQAKPALI